MKVEENETVQGGYLMVSMLDYRSSGPGSDPGRGRCAFLFILFFPGCLSSTRCINGHQRLNLNTGGSPTLC